MATVHLLIGIPGSGKSTYAKKLSKDINAYIVSTDLVRQMHRDWEESRIWPEVYSLCAKYLQDNHDVIFDATNVTPRVRERFINNVLACYGLREKSALPFTIGAYFFDVDPMICQKRVEKRNEDKNELYLPPEVVLSYGEKIIPPTMDEPFSFIKTITFEEEVA